MAKLSRTDLDFILDQILIAEAHANGAILTLLPDIFAPFGLRTVDGSFNNLVPGQQFFGAADRNFLLTIPQFFRDDLDGDTFDPDGPGGPAPALTNTNYAKLNITNTATVSVVDADPRIISNLIVDMTANNPAAVDAAAENPFAELVTSPGLDGVFGTADDRDVYYIPNITPDVGLSAPFNTWFTFFGQFFDHGLDLVNKGGNGTVFMPLMSDDPLFNPLSPTNFMVLTRATNTAIFAGDDTVFGTSDDIHFHNNQDTPFVDQNQTYTAHPSHQVFLREYALVDHDGNALTPLRPVATGNLLNGAAGGLPTWANVKAQAQAMLGIALDDQDVLNLPLLATDAYGKFIPNPVTGFAQIITTTGMLSGTPGSPVDASLAMRTNHAFLDDIAHTANPAGGKIADVDSIVGNAVDATHYDNELLNLHFITGDGRGNENIGLTTVHHIFHSEHNRQVAEIQATILTDAAASGVSFLNDWLRVDVAALPVTPAAIAALQWDGERIFQAARFATEMQYQHLVFEEFARKIQPNIDAFLAPVGYDATINAAIMDEFAHVVYRFGHSLLTETIDRFDPNFNVIDADPLHPAQDTSNRQIGLIAAFLNPLAFAASGATADQAAGAIVRGLTRQVGNEIDEFVTEAVRNNLVGLPLDLPAINLARGRDTGVPTLNQARAQFYAMTGDTQLTPYTSWVDLAANLKHESSIVNFIAAYGTHASITSQTFTADKRAAALAIVTGVGFAGTEADRLAFLNSTDVYANLASGVTTTGVDAIDLWIGGLAEKQMPFGGLLGSTFNFVFETQLEALQNGDRFYYLSRTAGLNFGKELENNSFAKLIMLNTDATHLPADVFTTPAFTLEVNSSAQFTGLGVSGREDPTGGSALIPLVIRNNPATPGADTNYLRYTGEDHVVLGGTAGNDIIISSIGDDTIYGDAGNDRLEGGDGVDVIMGGDGDDIITDLGGDDVIHGDAGNDVIQGGNGLNLLFGGTGQDFIITGEDISAVFAGFGNDFVLGAKTNIEVLGNEGDDWLEIGHQEGTAGDNGDVTGLDTIAGHDVFIGGGGFEDIIAEGGDDIIFGSDGQEKMDGASGFDWADYKFENAGVTADLKISLFRSTPATPSTATLLDLYAFVEGLSGTAFGDVLRGDDIIAPEFAAAGAQGSVLNQAGISRIAGLQELLGIGVTSFSGGNIILGGDGSDIIEGRRGDDIIDGDRWLNARISVRANADGTGAEIRSVDSMKDLIVDMLAGTINPGQLVIVREILTAAGPDFDTAMYTGPLANYTVTTAADGTTVVRDNVGTLLGTEGTDTLHNIERLQFSDQAVILPSGVGLNAAPVGLLQIRNAATNTADDTPSVNQLLSVFAGNVTDANIAAGGGVITGKPTTYYWQVERGLNSGIFEDIINPNGLGGAPTTADGPTLRVPTIANGLAVDGLRLRVRAVYADDNNVLENVFSAPTQVVAGVVAGPAAAGPIPAESSVNSAGIHLIRSDLQFILDQIVIAERHVAGEDLLALVGNERLPLGLRTVDGSFNNLVPGQTEFGAADNTFPLLLDQIFRNDQDGDSFDSNGPAPGGLITNTNYATTTSVVDADPRLISNLIVDMTANNPSANDAAAENPFAEMVTSPGLDGVFGTADDREVYFIPNTTPDVGLSAPFNAWFTFFGQFFDHGLDLVNKGGNGTVFIPLLPDDPLFVPGGFTNFMVITRASNIAVGAGADGIFNTADDVHLHNNQTTPFVDQNQTYTSHPSHQVFLREYALVDHDGIAATPLRPLATGNLLDGAFGGLPTWLEVKTQARVMLGINLTDADVTNLPGILADAYGKFIPGSNGFAQITTLTGLVQGNPAANGGLGVNIPANVIRTNHAFMDDIAHNAAPVSIGGVLQPDPDSITGNPVAIDPLTGARLNYDNELLNAHFITGDGRGNENIGLTTVHHIFHQEHNRLVDHIKDVAIASNDVAFLNQWLRVDVAALPATPAAIAALQWDGERIFQAARFATEMQYQHLVFEEFARTIQPQIDLFFATTQVYDTTLNPAIVDEFAHVVYRFGHSLLTETIDRFDPNFNIIDADPLHPAQDASGHQIGLIAAFLNPLAFVASGANANEAAGAIVRGLTRQVGNEIDEFVTEALRNNLVGLPLDLPAINLARGRDTGVPTLNQARAEFYAMTGDSQLAPYTSWVDLAANLKHESSIVNFIAAYGTHSSILNAPTSADKRAAAVNLVFGDARLSGAILTAFEADRLAFLNGPAASTGVNEIDLWIGGLAERQMPFGGLLGSTFNFVFETQMEKLQDGDRFYYLERTGGLNFLTELEGNSFAKLVMANTDATHLPGSIFTTPTFILEVDPSKQFTELGVSGREDPTGGSLLVPLVIRNNPATVGPDSNYLRYTGEDHVVLGGTAGNDIIISSIGDDTLYGDAGNDRLEGGDGNDTIFGGPGDDILTDLGGDDNIQGGDGNDAIQGGNGINLIIGGFGNDFINSGEDASEIFGGPGNDFLLGSRANEQDMGNEGDDWIEHGNADGSPGDNFDPFGRDPVIGNDVYVGDSTVDIMNAEGGDDIMVGNGGQTDHYLGASGYDWAVYKDSPLGVAVFLDLQFENEATALGVNPSTLDRFLSVEGVSGSQHADILVGSDRLTPAFAIGENGGFTGSILTNFALIDGLSALVAPGLDAGGASFTGEILLGGAGTDLLKGGWGNEIIDGDAWLNVQIGVYNPLDVNHTGTPISTHNSMTEIMLDVFKGLINPGQLSIIREIRTTLLDGSPIGPDFDTAMYSDVLANYDIVFNDNGTPGNLTDDFVVVTDIGTGLDGVDILRHVERLQFSDQSLVIDGSNGIPEGSLNISDNTPIENQLLTVGALGVIDPDNIGPGNLTGAITQPITYYWQTEGTGGTFVDILFDNGITLAPVTGMSFTPGDLEVGFALRVRGVYKDANDVLEQVYSDPTDPVAAVNDAPVGTVAISDMTGTETQALVASIQFTDADAPLDLVGGGLPPPLVYNYQWQQSALGGGAAFTNIAGATAVNFTPGAGQVNRQLRVVVTYVDGQGFNNTVTSAATVVTGDSIPANAAAQTLTGNEGQDIIFGGDGNDIINANGQDDIINGGLGNDTINAGAGNDTINYTIGDGADVFNGGTGFDTLNILGTAANNTLDVVIGDAALISIEAVTLDMLGGTDTLSYAATATPVTVDLAAGTGTGFISIANVENVTGGLGNDLIAGNAGNNILNGGAGAADTVSYANATAGVTVSLAIAAAQNTIGAGTDTLSNFENLIGSSLNDILTGNAGNNVINGGMGADTLNGGDAVDTLVGGAADDIVNGDGGNDIINYTIGDGADTVNGGANTDTLNILGTAGDDTLDVVLTGAVLTIIEGGTITAVESVTVNLLGGTDTLSYAGTTANVTVNLATGAASGFTPPIVGIENVTGGSGNDTLTGDGLNNVLSGGIGTDTLNGAGGADTLIGGLGNDIVNGDAGDDLIVYTIGDGADTVNGGANNDTLQILGTAGNDTLDVIFSGGVLTRFESAVNNLTSIEAVDVNLYAGIDTLSYAGTTAAVSVDLAAGTGSGFTASLDGIENVTTGGGDDNVTGGAGNNALDGLGGTDTAHYAGVWADYTVLQPFGGGVTVIANVSSEGTDSLTNFERIQFADQLIILGNNPNPPVIGAFDAAGAVTEIADNAAGENTATHIDSGIINFTDAVLTDVHTTLVIPVGGGVGYRGTLTAAVTDSATGDGIGQVTWTYSVADSALDDLAAGQTLIQTYNVVIDDGDGGFAVQPVTITITGTNDVPVIGVVDAAGAAIERADGAANENTGSLTDTGTLAFTDVDLTDAHSVTATAQAAGYRGTLTPSVSNASTGDGAGVVTWDYSVLASALDDLAAGETLIQNYDVAINDGHVGGTATQVVTITLTGTNDAPVFGVVDAAGAVTERADGAANENAAPPLTDTGALAFTDVDLNGLAHIVTVIPQGVGYRGTLTASVTNPATGDGAGVVTWDYTVPAAALDNLAAGQTLIQTYNVTVNDGQGGIATQLVTITLTGTNDVPVIGVAGTDALGLVAEMADGAVGEGTNTLSDVGTIAFTDVDLTNAHTTTVTPQAAGFLGTLTASVSNVSAGDGAGVVTWIYTVLDSALGALVAGQTVNQLYNVTVNDGSGGIATQVVTITLTGAADVAAPVVIAGTAGNDTLNGTAGNDTINAGAGNDTINAGAGNDTINGGTGNDTTHGDAGNDIFNYTIGDGGDLFDGGADTDTLNIYGTAGGDTLDVVVGDGALVSIEIVNLNLLGGTDTLTYDVTPTAVTVDLAAATGTAFNFILNVENVTGGLSNDLISGNAGNNVLNGGAGAADTVSYANALAAVTVNLGTAGGQNTVGAGTDTLSNFENLIGSAFNDTLTGNGGNNVITGGAGNDTMNGGAGNDTFVFATNFGDDIINGFDANATGGQDLLHVGALGITAGNFATSVIITDLGANTLIEFVGLTDSILLNGVDGVGANSITVTDFIFV